MTLTFYYRHQRTAHSDETPAKSFHHQLCQLQKKAFECKDCGLKFSRSSALHSHQLHHTDVFRETEKEAQMCSSLPQDQMAESGRPEIDLETSTEGKVQLDSLPPTNMTEELYIVETDEDMESYEPGDFNVQVISASESEDEPPQDLNPDLELVCESDQEGRDDTREAENKSAEDRFDCPECYRWFSSSSSLRVHRMWHGVYKRRQQAQGQSAPFYTCDTCGHEASSFEAHCHHIQTHEKKNLTCSECGKVFSRLGIMTLHMRKHENGNHKCELCNRSFRLFSSLLRHQVHQVEQLKKNTYSCPDCGKLFSRAKALQFHMKSHGYETKKPEKT
uniref:C2H2-type domain-containing protein n=1 Tax=Astatotilapia calliptera TaxID=8154 RepID=A0AAX7VQ11_ASTCA